MQQNTDKKHAPMTDASSEDRPLPLGLMMALAQNMQAMKQYATLGDAERARFIECAANTHSKAQMQALVDHISEFL